MVYKNLLTLLSREYLSTISSDFRFKKHILSLFLLGIIGAVNGQSPGDTIRVQGFNFDSQTRDSSFSFPDDNTITYEKILLKYTMRCKDGLVSNATDRNLGCGEWDYSCNTYLADSSKIEAVPTFTPSHVITNYSELNFPYKQTPVYNYMRGTQTDVEIISTTSEFSASISEGDEVLSRTLSTSNLAGKSQYLYTATELLAAGLVAGNIDGLSLNVLSSAGVAKFLRIKLKNSSQTELSGVIETEQFTEVYYKNTVLDANQSNRFQFHTPFVWDGSSNVLVEFNFSNIDASSLAETLVEGDITTSKMSLTSTNEQEIMLTNNTYVECENYTGIGGAQNRTTEAWIKTSSAAPNGEIVSWGANVTGTKWVWRLTSGRLRLEIAGGGTESTTAVNDGEWHHVACVLNGNDLSDIEFYIDGVLDANSTTGTALINTNTSGTANVRISRGINNRYIDGLIDDVRIWDTNLSESTINNWKNLKVDSSHPNFANLKVDYQFSSTGTTIVDSSPNSISATIIGNETRLTELDGEALFKDFKLSNNRAQLTLFQGDYVTNITTAVEDRPVAKEPAHFVTARSIVPSDPSTAVDDIVVSAVPIQYWSLDQKIFDESTGALIEETILSADGEIVTSELEYTRRFPFYNELTSFVTPYGIGLDLGMEGATWYMDMTDYVTILKGDKRILMTLGGQWQEDIDLEFLFIVGTPPRDVLQYEQIWQGTNRTGIAQISQILNDSKLPPAEVPLNSEANSFKLKSSITGHGSEGEFGQNGGEVNHQIYVDQDQKFNWTITQGCSMNPIFPQGGTWIYDRQGWCPGEQTLLKEQDLTPFVTPGNSMTIDYTTSNPQVATGDYRYHVAHQLVGYGDANFQLDAAIVEIMSPNNLAKFTRTGTVCANPTVLIRNTGATALTSLTINYWMNDSQSPQSFEWTGDLEFMEEEVVTIPSTKELWFDVLGENNVFYAEVSNPNQGVDGYSQNNTYQSNFDVPQIYPHNLTVEFRTNNEPSDNNYSIVDGAGNVIGSNSLPTANTTYFDDYDFIDECYKLIVNDAGNDGVQWWANAAQGNGYVRLRSEDGMIIKAFESDFGGGFEYSFSTDFVVSAEELDFLTSIKVFPNPTNQFFTIESNNLMEANVFLINAMGQQVASPMVVQNDNQLTFDVQDLSTGIYFIVLQKDDIKTTRKLIIE